MYEAGVEADLMPTGEIPFCAAGETSPPLAHLPGHMHISPFVLYIDFGRDNLELRPTNVPFYWA